MKLTRSIQIFFLIMIVLSGCKSHKAVVQVPVRTVERRVTTYIPVRIPGDSASFRAYFECDSLNNVLLKEISEQKSKNISTEYNFKDGLLDYNAETHPDTVWLPIDTVYLEQEVPIEVEVPVVEIRMSKFQRFFFILGLIAAGTIIVWITIKIKKLNFFKL